MRQLRWAFFGILIATWCGTPVRAAPPTEPPTTPSTTEVAPVEQPPPIVDPQVVSAPLIATPVGCTAPPAPIAVFVGTLAAADATTARFGVEQIRAGSLDGYAVDTIVDVRYGDDIRFLHPGDEYLVGAAPDAVTGLLSSKVRLAAPLFGGDAVIGVNDTDVRCPRFEDGVKTLLADGTDVDTGVLAPLKTAKRSLLKAVLKPLGIAVGVLIVLAAVKLLVFAMVRTIREAADDDVPPPLEVQRDRQHIDDDSIDVRVTAEQR
ncbi:MAG TPA: hypothetical protein VHN36_08625 [Ilumatobacteraceae bacterium]|nr:hypothetical protein [Ilumatobacteraceae bacterium]